eukprot:m.298805 g.298805  ORF g.298805 m.298805 type:complete len:457 (-) comp16293_c0_seq2:1027-2397(-)
MTLLLSKLTSVIRSQTGVRDPQDDPPVLKDAPKLATGVLARARTGNWSVDDAKTLHVLHIRSASRMANSTYSLTVSDGEMEVSMTSVSSDARVTVHRPTHLGAVDRAVPIVARVAFTVSLVGVFPMFRATRVQDMHVPAAIATRTIGSPVPRVKAPALDPTSIICFRKNAADSSPAPLIGFRSPHHRSPSSHPDDPHPDPPCNGHDCRQIYADRERMILLGDADNSPHCILVDYPLADFEDGIPDRYLNDAAGRPRDPDSYSMAERRHICYFRIVKQIYLCTGRHQRAIAAPCWALAIRRKSPDPNGIYTGHQFGPLYPHTRAPDSDTDPSEDENSDDPPPHSPDGPPTGHGICPRSPETPAQQEDLTNAVIREMMEMDELMDKEMDQQRREQEAARAVELASSEDNTEQPYDEPFDDEPPEEEDGTDASSEGTSTDTDTDDVRQILFGDDEDATP